MDDIVKKLREYAGKVHHAPATEAMISAADHIDSLEEKLTENVKAPGDELTRYIARCREMSTSGLSKQEIKDGKTYSWWSRLAEILTALEAQLSDKVKVKPLEWSEVRQPDGEIRYHHVIAESPIGQWTIEWKGWKDYDDRTIFLGGDYIANGGDDLDLSKAAAQADYERRILSALSPCPPIPHG